MIKKYPIEQSLSVKKNETDQTFSNIIMQTESNNVNLPKIASSESIQVKTKTIKRKIELLDGQLTLPI